MLGPTPADLRVVGIGLAHDRAVHGDHDGVACPPEASGLELAAVALDLTLERITVARSEIAMVVFACETFDCDRPPAAVAEPRGALLDNEFNDAVVRRLIFERELTAATPFGVSVEAGLGTCVPLALARGFSLGEDDLRDIVVVTLEGTRPGHRRASGCMLTRHKLPWPIIEHD